MFLQNSIPTVPSTLTFKGSLFPQNQQEASLSRVLFAETRGGFKGSVWDGFDLVYFIQLSSKMWQQCTKCYTMDPQEALSYQ